jgi:hypothetical protein
MNRFRFPVICIFSNEGAVLPLNLYNIYWAEPSEYWRQFHEDYYLIYFTENDIKPCSWQVYHKDDFITLAEWRENQINQILEDD